MRDGNFRPPPQNAHPLTDHRKIWYRWLCRRPLRLCQIRCKSVDAHDLGKWVKYNDFLYIPFFINSPTGKTRWLIFTLGGSNDADSRKDVTFGGFVDIAPHFGGEIHQKPQFWRLQAKRAKYWKFHVIKTTASISTKFCTTIETIRWSSWVVTIGAQQIQDGGQPPFWKKTLNRHISATDFDEI